jgi:ubiquinone/menaquinone biosynthesis C-methylase UbiE
MNPQASYKNFWDDKAATAVGAMGAVDGSADESVLALTGTYTARQVTAALNLGPASRVLELGCGVGRIGSQLAPKVAFWHGVDISDNMVKVASERLAAFTHVKVTPLTRTVLDGIEDASLDAAYCVAVFIHMDKEDWYLYLEELQRVLKPGGRIYFDHWNLAHPVGWRRWYMEAAEYRRHGQGQRKDVARNQFTTPEETRQFVAQAGFELLQLLTDSPWVQAIAVKPGGYLPHASLAQEVAKRQPEIAYSARWSVYFDRVIDILMGGEHPREFAAALAAEKDEESAMYRAWIIGIWRQQTERWGPCNA